MESHHTATKEWARELGIPEGSLNSMPALVLDRAWHRQFNNSGVPRDYILHNILRNKMRGVNGADRDDVIRRLRETYRQFEGIDAADPDPDVWLVTEAWLDRNLSH